MRFSYSKWNGRGPDDEKLIQQLMEIYRNLLLQTGGDVDEALRWMEHFGEQYGFFNDKFGLEDFKKLLEESGEAQRTAQGYQITPKGEKRIRQDSLNEIFSSLQAGSAGDHRTPVAGKGGERLSETRAYQFGDDLANLDPLGTIGNAVKRSGIDDLSVTEEDLSMFETEHLSACATVLMVDVSHSMILYGEDRFTPAKKVALALAHLIRTQYPGDSLRCVLFHDSAEELAISQLARVQVGPYYTNTRDGLILAQRILMQEKKDMRQIVMITDGKPSALTLDDGRMYRNAFGLDPLVISRTLEEVNRCKKQGILINTFMLASDYGLVNFIQKVTEMCRGKAYFATPQNLGQYLLMDYMNRKTRTIH
jgi:Ca-activated chloride channel homolog